MKKLFIALVLSFMCISGFAQDARTLIKNEVSATNMYCPMTIGQGLSMTKVELTDDNVVYYYQGDDNLYSFSQEMAGPAKASAIEALHLQEKSMPAMTEFLKNLRAAKIGIIYRYETSSTSMDVVIPYDEL